MPYQVPILALYHEDEDACGGFESESKEGKEMVDEFGEMKGEENGPQ
jgi:hypothetical protein